MTRIWVGMDGGRPYGLGSGIPIAAGVGEGQSEDLLGAELDRAP